VRRDVQGAERRDEAGRVVALVGTERGPVATCLPAQHGLCGVALGGAGGRCQHGVDDQLAAVLHQQVAHMTELCLFAAPRRISRASGSVVEAWVALLRRSPWKSRSALPPPALLGGSSSLGLKLSMLAHAWISVPSTVKC